MKITISTSYSGTLPFLSGQFGAHEVTVQPRASDWGLSGTRKYVHLISQTLQILRTARHHDALVLCTVGIEAFLAGKWKSLFCRNTRLICFDLLLPKESRQLQLLRPWLKGVNGFACIRRGDMETLTSQYAIPPEYCRFVPFPVVLPSNLSASDDGDYVYSAGWAHRDWNTLCQALETLPYHAVLSAGVPLSIPVGASGHIETLPMQSPEAGRAHMARARTVVLSFKDTYLPSGPLVLLDAMAMGKAVIATDVNGTRDYIIPGQTGLLVPPSDAQALASAICCLMENAGLRKEMGRAAQQNVTKQFTLTNSLNGILRLCEEMSK